MSDLLGSLIGPMYGVNQGDLANASTGQLIRCQQAQQAAAMSQFQMNMLHHQAEVQKEQRIHDMNHDMVPDPCGTMKSVLEEMIARINALQDEVQRLRGERVEPQREVPVLEVETESKSSSLKQRIDTFKRRNSQG